MEPRIKIENDPLSVCIDYPLQSKLDSNSLINELISKHNITLDLLENTLKDKGYGYKSLIGKKLGKFGIMSWTTDGKLLRSAAEYRFYQKLKTKPRLTAGFCGTYVVYDKCKNHPTLTRLV